MKKFLLAPFLAALATFFLGFLYWGAPHHLPYKGLGTVADEGATALAIGKLFPASGAYLLPSPPAGEDKMNELALRGPSVEVHILKESFSGADMGKCMGLGFAHMFVLSLLLAIILTRLEKSLVCWTCCVKFTAFLGLIVAVGELGNSIWWHHSLAWTLALSAYDLMIYTTIGLVLAKFVTPKPAA